MNKKVILASIIGNALEFFDFTLYGVFSGVIAELFFPSSDLTASLLMSLGAFAVGFLMRPFGALIFGYLGDVFGRKKALSFSVLLMGVPTFIIAILPGHASIGIFASLMIVFCRLLQGICTGGEYNGAAIFALEHTRRKPGFTGGLITASCVIGAFSATFLGSITQIDGMPEWAWRVPFLLGAVISVAGFYIRKNLSETPEFLDNQAIPLTTFPLFKALFSYKKSCLLTFSLGALNGTLSYTLFGFLNIYLSRYLSVPLSEAMSINLFGLLAFMIGSPLLGAVYDRSKNHIFLKYASFLIFGGMIPIFLLNSSSTYSLIVIGQIALGICVASIAGTGHAAMQKLFPVKERYSGISFFFSLGMGIFGGIAPMIYVQAIEKDNFPLLFPAYFLMALSILFFGIVKFCAFKEKKSDFSNTVQPLLCTQTDSSF